MIFGFDTLVFTIIGVIFILTEANSKSNNCKAKRQPEKQTIDTQPEKEVPARKNPILGTDLTAKQTPVPASVNPVPLFFDEPSDFHRKKTSAVTPVSHSSSFNDPGYRTFTNPNGLVRLQA